MRKNEPSRTFLIHYKSCSLHLNYQFREGIQTSAQIIPRVTKRREPRGTMHSQYPIPNCFQYWSKNTRFPSYRLSLESLHILNGMISMLDVNTMAGFKGTLQKAAHHSKIRFKLYLMQIQLSSKNSSKVFRGDRINQGQFVFLFQLHFCVYFLKENFIIT